MDQTMEGKVAVVTGASRGIGKAIAVKLASKGATVVINYNGSRERAEEVKNEVESAGGKAVIIQCNVADFDACKEFIEAVIKEQGRIDILVNNAGITKDGLLMKMSEEEYNEADALAKEIIEQLIAAKKIGDPSSKEAQALAELHKKWLSIYWDKYSKEAHAGVAQMYVCDERFKEYYDKHGEGLAEFLRDAIVEYTRDR